MFRSILCLLFILKNLVDLFLPNSYDIETINREQKQSIVNNREQLKQSIVNNREQLKQSIVNNKKS